VLPSQEAGEPPLVHHADPVGDQQRLLQLGRDVEDRAARSAEGQYLVDDEARGSRIEPTRGLLGDENGGPAAELAREYDLLLIAAGERTDHGGRPGCANPEIRDPLARQRGHGVGIEPGTTAHRRLVERVQREVLGNGHVDDEPRRRAIGGDVRETGGAARGHTPGRDIRAVHEDSAARRSLDPDDHASELGLPVAVHADEGEHLTRPHREAQAAHTLDTARVALGEIGEDEALGPGRARGAIDRRADVPADHPAGELVTIDAGRLRAARHLAVTQDDDLVTDLQHFPELVGDEDDRPALLTQPPQDVEKRGDFRRAQARGRLVQDEQLGTAEYGLHDLDALLGAER
jgi:hypothetical protein